MEKKANSNYYFTQETEDAIVRYNESSDSVYKSTLFRDELYYPFYKMAENLIHTFKFYYMDVNDVEDLKYEIVSMVVESKLQGFNPSNGAKAFSYFQTIIKRWLIKYNADNYKKLKKLSNFDDIEEQYEETDIITDSRVVPISKLVDIFVKEAYENLYNNFQDPRDLKVADAILTLFKTRYDLEIFEKKALYIYIREMTDCETPILTRVIKKLKADFSKIYSRYVNNGYLVQ